MNWLITGAAGFIGSNLCAHLLHRGHSVVGLDNFATGRRANVEWVARRGGRFRLMEGDIRDRAAVRQAAQGCEAVVHLAAQGSVQKSFADPFWNNEVNITGFLHTLYESAATGARVFVYASSCAIYGDCDTLPISEREPPRPLSPYAVSKLANDLYSAALAHLFPGTALIGLRLFNIFGPRQDPSGDYAAVIPKWIDMCLQGERPLVYGDGGATRDFCYVGNVCALIESLGARHPESGHRIYNVGTGIGTSLLELYAAVTAGLAAGGRKPPFAGPEHRPWREGDIVHSRADVAKARHELGFQPRTGLQEGIGLILQDYESGKGA